MNRTCVNLCENPPPPPPCTDVSNACHLLRHCRYCFTSSMKPSNAALQPLFTVAVQSHRDLMYVSLDFQVCILNEYYSVYIFTQQVTEDVIDAA